MGVFYYYGRKKNLARAYPEAQYDTLVEPFAGSAAYALCRGHWMKKVILVERDPSVAALWRWLIEEATEDSILGLPDPVEGQHTDLFIHIVHAASNAALNCKRYMPTPMLMQNWPRSKKYMARNVHKVKHWTIIEGDYTLAPDVEATWFIDPPYQGEPGEGYRYGSAQLDYAAVAEWVKCRRGEVLVCEQASATWLPFEPFKRRFVAAGKQNTEGLYYRSPHAQVGVMELFGEGAKGHD